jgi:dTDP-4-dehydrorhamnose reductase
MKLLITGADGQLGRCLQDRCKKFGFETIAVNRASLDITDKQAVEDFVFKHKPAVIINAAAYTAVDKAEKDIKAAEAVNALAVGYLAAAADQVDAIFLHVSTDYVFDGEALQPYLESDPVAPLGVYGETKLVGEVAAITAKKYFILRTAWVFSEYGQNFLKTMLRLANERDSLAIVSDQIGTPTYAGDLAEALLFLASFNHNSEDYGLYHFNGGRTSTWFDFAEVIFDKAVSKNLLAKKPELSKILTKDYPTPAKRPHYSVLDGNKLNKTFKLESGNWDNAINLILEKI